MTKSKSGLIRPFLILLWVMACGPANPAGQVIPTPTLGQTPIDVASLATARGTPLSQAETPQVAEQPVPTSTHSLAAAVSSQLIPTLTPTTPPTRTLAPLPEPTPWAAAWPSQHEAVKDSPLVLTPAVRGERCSIDHPWCGDYAKQIFFKPAWLSHNNYSGRSFTRIDVHKIRPELMGWPRENLSDPVVRTFQQGDPLIVALGCSEPSRIEMRLLYRYRANFTPLPDDPEQKVPAVERHSDYRDKNQTLLKGDHESVVSIHAPAGYSEHMVTVLTDPIPSKLEDANVVESVRRIPDRIELDIEESKECWAGFVPFDLVTWRTTGQVVR